MKKTKKIIISVVAALTIVVIAGLGVGGGYLYNLGLNPNSSKDLIFGTREKKEDMVVMKQSGGLVSMDSNTWLLEHSNYKDLYMESRDGLKLHNYLIKNDKSNKWVITVHGYCDEGKVVAPQAKNFYDMGYNVIIPDLRGHGKSEGDYIGMGWDERHDMVDLVNYIVKEDPKAEIVLYGVSMGAATVMNTSGEDLPSNVKAVIEDCGYTSVRDEFGYQLKQLFNLSEFPMLDVASLIARVKAGYWLGDASPIDQIEKSKTPTLFIHGDKDDFVPFFMMDKLYDKASVPKEKLIIPGAEHAKASKVAPELYWKTVNNFLNKYVK